jgi:bacteriorhodopsin
MTSGQKVYRFQALLNAFFCFVLIAISIKQETTGWMYFALGVAAFTASSTSDFTN